MYNIYVCVDDGKNTRLNLLRVWKGVVVTTYRVMLYSDVSQYILIYLMYII